MVRLVFFLLFFVFSTSVFAVNSGEIDLKLYYGPRHYEVKNQFYFQKPISRDSLIENELINGRISREIFDLSDYVLNEFQLGNSCPDHFYHGEKNYLNYLFRALVLSSLTVSIDNTIRDAKILNFKNSCNYSMDKLLDDCRPKDKNLSKFIDKIKKTSSQFLNSEKSFSNFSGGFESQFNSFKEKYSDHVSYQRFIKNCSKGNCKPTRSNFEKSLTSSCHQEVKTFQSICREDDHLYGLSNSPEAFYLIMSSTALNYIEEESYRSGCLKRYVLENQNKEMSIRHLKDLLSYFYSKSIETRALNPQLRLFSLGAMRELEEKGLTELFSPINEPLISPSKKTEEKKEKVIKPVFEKITLKEYKKEKIVKKSKPIPKIIPKTVVFKSHFLKSSELRRDESLSFIDIDMFQFRNDFVFTEDQKEKIKESINPFVSYKGLTEMLKRDKLGSKKAPLPLKMLKFLIDQEMHKELFNIINVLGDKFFILNNIDKGITQLEYIQISNNQMTNYQWQIKILEE